MHNNYFTFLIQILMNVNLQMGDVSRYVITLSVPFHVGVDLDTGQMERPALVTTFYDNIFIIT